MKDGAEGSASLAVALPVPYSRIGVWRRPCGRAVLLSDRWVLVRSVAAGRVRVSGSRVTGHPARCKRVVLVSWFAGESIIQADSSPVASSGHRARGQRPPLESERRPLIGQWDSGRQAWNSFLDSSSVTSTGASGIVPSRSASSSVSPTSGRATWPPHAALRNMAIMTSKPV